MVDFEVLKDDFGAASVTSENVLTELLKHHYVEVLRYADTGPPSTVAASQVKPHHTEFYDGWVIVDDRGTDGAWSVTYPVKGGFARGGVIGNAVEVAERDTGSAAYRDQDEAQARGSRGADVLAAQVACQALEADIFVTERPYLHAATWRVAPGLTICRPDEAVALVSLYLRAQGEFHVASRYRFNRGLFYWVGTRALLPSAWRWFGACVQHASAAGNHALVLLGGSLLQRVDRALEARDAIHVSLNQPQNNDVRDDALSSLDVVLLFLMGALDVAARVAHRTLELPPGEEYSAGWQSRRWLTSVANVSPQLASVVAAGTTNKHVLTILRLLRNSVHGAALHGMAFHQGARVQESLVGLPADDEAELLAAMNALGGEGAWGARTILPGQSHIDPGVLVDRLFEAVLPLLNELMDATPVERLPGVALTSSDIRPPDKADSPFASWVRQSIRLQLGL